jgi:hypothetical protein
LATLLTANSLEFFAEIFLGATTEEYIPLSMYIVFSVEIRASYGCDIYKTDTLKILRRSWCAALDKTEPSRDSEMAGVA